MLLAGNKSVSVMRYARSAFVSWTRAPRGVERYGRQWTALPRLIG